MIVMVIVMFLPILAIPVFWLLPLREAIIVYVVCCLLSGRMFWIMRTARRRPVVTGREALMGREGKVIATLRRDGTTSCTLRLDGALWTGRSADPLEPGQRVTVTGSEGTILLVKRADDDQQGPGTHR
jgi:membrane protein implicated in regulation of membrane protease activity